MAGIAAIEFRDVCGGYHAAPLVLHSVNFTVQPGEIVGVIGPNGAGKTTLFRILSGLLSPASGRAFLAGKDAGGLPARARARIVAVVPQQLKIPAILTVEELVMIGRTAALNRFQSATAEDRSAVEKALVYTDMSDLRSRPAGNLSGGERQRAVVALTLAQEPDTILMDEPTSHLDFHHRLEIMHIVERLNAERGMTVLMTSHDLNIAAEFCRRLLILDRGRLVADGPPRDVLTEHLLRRIYRCDIRVNLDPQTGLVNTVPARRLTAPHSGKGIHVHVIAGGGSGEEVLRLLTLCDYTVTAGVLNQGDTDAQVAATLGIKAAIEEPFAHIDNETLVRARALSSNADAIVVTDVHFGPGNLANLSLAEHALDAGRPVFIMDADIEARDHTPLREAVARIRAMVARGAVASASVTEMALKLPRRARET